MEAKINKFFTSAASGVETATIPLDPAQERYIGPYFLLYLDKISAWPTTELAYLACFFFHNFCI